MIRHIKENIGTPDYITTDDARAEYKAIRMAFGQEVMVHLCLWHVMKAWSNKLRSTIRRTEERSAKELKEGAMSELCAILYDLYLDRAMNRAVEFKYK
jgi:hypothetical protein